MSIIRSFLARSLATVVVVCSILSIHGTVLAAEKHPVVVILNSYHPGEEWSDNEIAGIIPVLRACYPNLVPSIEYLDAKRFQAQDHLAFMKDYLKKKYDGRRVDLLIALDNPALDLIAKYGKELFPEVPLVFAGISDFHPGMLAGRQKTTGIVEQHDIAGTLRLATTLQPGLKKVLFVHDYTRSGIAVRRDVEAVKPEFAGKIDIRYSKDIPFDELSSELKNVPADSAVMILSYSTDKTGRIFTRSESTRLITSLSRAPVYSMHETRLGYGIVGGVLLEGKEHGRQAAALALRVLDGEAPDSIPVERSRSRTVIDYNILSRFDIPKERWPEEAVIINRPPSIWQRHGTVLLPSVVIIAILVSTTAMLSLTIRRLRRTEAERLSLEQQLLHAQKLESLGVLAGGIAHDFNNILTAIVGNVEIAMKRLDRQSPALKNLLRIETAAARAGDLARQMLAYSGKGAFVIEPTSINRLVEELGHMLEVSTSKKARINYNLSGDLPILDADATQLRQVLMNLVINASEAIGDRNGVITITTGQLDCNEEYFKGCWLADPLPAGTYVFVEVTDTGCGMDKETQAKIFDPFFTTKFTGRGLGMAAVLGIVRGHKGAIRVSSEPGNGTSFRVLFPVGERRTVVPSKDDPLIEEWKGSGVILLVDDEDTLLSVGSEMLRELGFDTVTACDGQEAVEIFRARSDINAVILDLTMPKMDGEQCFHELQQLNPDVKVIISSGFSESEVTQKFVGKGAAGFVQKPYKLTTLRNLLRTALGA